MIKFVKKDEDFIVLIAGTESPMAPDIVETFYHFMLGAGFARETIIAALEGVIEEHGDE